MTNQKEPIDLDAQYRAEGWGRITDQAFAGRVAPKDVESQAREVARYAHETISDLKRMLTECKARTSMSRLLHEEIETAIAKAGGRADV